MQRMTGLDASFLYMEGAAVFMHTVSVLIVDVSTMRGGYSFERVWHLFERRIHLVPLLRRRVVEIPRNLHHPLWIEDPEFDLSRHLRRITLGAPGDEQALESLVGELLAQPLDREHPLWEITVVEGLESGHLALLCKAHHATIDGMAIAAVLERVMSDDFDAPDVRPPAQPWVSEPVPGAWRLVTAALRERLVGLLRLPRLVGRTALAGARLLRRMQEYALDLSLPFSGPCASFNGPLTPRRSYASGELRLSALQETKSALGCTLNDVVLAGAAEGVRRYLARRGEVHRRSLLASVPVATGGDEDERLGGNKVSSLLISLRTDIADPLARLRAIKALTRAAKRAHDLEIGGLLEKWAEYARPWLVRLVFSRVLPRVPRPPINLVISNIRGATETRYLGGAELVRMYLAGPLLERVGLNLTVWSYRDTLHLGVVACPDALSDPTALLDECLCALSDLVTAAWGVEPRSASERDLGPA